MSEAKSELKAWINEINGAKTSLQIFKMLEDFRVGNWSDDDRAQIAKVYIAALGRMDRIQFPGDAKADAAAAVAAAAEETKAGGVAVALKDDVPPVKEKIKIEEDPIDEEVWYEKM